MPGFPPAFFASFRLFSATCLGPGQWPENGERSRKRAAQAEMVKKMGSERRTKPGVWEFFCPHFSDKRCAVGGWPMDTMRSWIGNTVPGQSLGGLESMGAPGSPRPRPKPARQNHVGQNDEARPPVRPAPSMVSMILPLHDFVRTCAKPLGRTMKGQNDATEDSKARWCHKIMETESWPGLPPVFFASFRLFSANHLAPGHCPQNGAKSRERAAQAEVVKKMESKRCTNPGGPRFFCPHFFDKNCAVGEWPMDSNRSWIEKPGPGQSLGWLGIHGRSGCATSQTQAGEAESCRAKR